MGLHITSVNGLKHAKDYQLYVLAYCVSPLSPEFRIIQKNFAFLAESIGDDGLVVAGKFGDEFGGNFAGFLEELDNTVFPIAHKLYHARSMSAFPTPALVVIKQPDDGQAEAELAYFHIQGYGEAALVSLFRQITVCDDNGKLRNIQGNLFQIEEKQLVNRLWNSLLLKPSIAGMGVDIKKLFD